MNYLSIDIGTTCCKCQLFEDNGQIKEYLFNEYPLIEECGEKYVDIVSIKNGVFDMIKEISAKHTVDSLCFSTFGEAFVLLDKEDNVLCKPMLYTDKRGEQEAGELTERFGNKRIFECTGTIPHHMYSVSKLLWIKKHYPELYAKADKVLLICDYLGYVLTGKRVIDYSLAARTGIFNILTLDYDTELLDSLEINPLLFSSPMRAGTVVGKIKDDVAEALNIKGCKLVLGSHDQVCTALGAGILEKGQAVDGMGTVECITAVYQGVRNEIAMGEQGYTCVPYAIDGLYCTYIVHYSSGSAINWFKNDILHRYKGAEQSSFSYLEKGMKDTPSGILTLPYFAGSMIPYQDINARAAIIGLTTSTTDSLIYQSLMEGLAMEMKLETAIAEKYGIKIKKAVATGGGANSEKWMQIKADVQRITYKVLRSSEGGLCGCAVLQAVAFGRSYKEAVKAFVKTTRRYVPDSDNSKRYAPYYKKYKKLYKSIKEYM